LVILGILALIRWLQTSPRGRSTRDKTPLEIVQERYARGQNVHDGQPASAWRAAPS